MVRIKICGITNAEDARAAAAVGADAIGMVFYHKSPRALDAVRTQEVLTALPPWNLRCAPATQKSNMVRAG